jgi:hypothetical protein
MPRQCSVCSHEDSVSINEALILEGLSNRAITRLFGVSKDAIRRHREHIPQLLVKALEAEEASQADDLLRQVNALQGKTIQLLKDAEGSGDIRTALVAIREARGNVELLARLRQIIDERPQINLVLSSEWVELRTVIAQALEPYDEAKAAVVRALSEAENGSH